MAYEVVAAAEDLFQMLRAVGAEGRSTWDVGVLTMPVRDGAGLEVDVGELTGALRDHGGDKFVLRLDPDNGMVGVRREDGSVWTVLQVVRPA